MLALCGSQLISPSFGENDRTITPNDCGGIEIIYIPLNIESQFALRESDLRKGAKIGNYSHFIFRDSFHLDPITRLLRSNRLSEPTPISDSQPNDCRILIDIHQLNGNTLTILISRGGDRGLAANFNDSALTPPSRDTIDALLRFLPTPLHEFTQKLIKEFSD